MSNKDSIDRVWDIIEKVGVCMLTTQFAAGLRARPTRGSARGIWEDLQMADRVYSLVKGPAGWVLFLDGARVGGIYGTKEAAFEAVMVAASFVVGVGDGV
jgi:hypothetical protein